MVGTVGVRGASVGGDIGRDEASIELETALKGAALCSAWLLFISPMIDFQEVRRKKDVGERILFPYVCMWISCCLWTQHGLYIGDIFPMFATNMLGLFCSTYYCAVFVWAANGHKERAEAVNMVGIAVFIASGMGIFCFFGSDPEEIKKKWGGLAAAVFSVVQYGSPLAGLRKVVRRKTTEGLSGPLTFLSLICGCIWLGYGMVLRDPFVCIPNLLGILLSAIQCSVFLLYPSRKPVNADTNAGLPKLS